MPSLSPRALISLVDRAQALGIAETYIDISREVDHYSDPRIIAGGVSMRTTVEPPMIEVCYSGTPERNDSLTLDDKQVVIAHSTANTTDARIYRMIRGCIRAVESARGTPHPSTTLTYIERKTRRND